MKYEQPNIFKHATKELSQDALLAWLLAWADPNYNDDENKTLHACAQDFVCKLLAKHGVELQASDIVNVRTDTQVQRVDVACIVNEEHHIVIEDKLSGADSEEKLRNTLKKYQDNKKPASGKIYPTYFKTHNEANIDYTVKAGFEVFDRKDFLEVLNNCKTENATFQDYCKHLRKIDAEYESYNNKRLTEWTDRAWQGFYSKLQHRLEGANWAYSSNPNGGHYIFWWHALPVAGGNIFCQIDSTNMNVKNNADREDIHLQVRVSTEKDKKHQSKFRKLCYEKAGKAYAAKAKDNPLYRVEKPAWFSTGRSMRILCALDKIFVFDGNEINIDSTTENLKNFALILCDARKEMQ